MIIASFGVERKSKNIAILPLKFKMDEMNWIMDETICNNTHRIHIEYTSPTRNASLKVGILVVQYTKPILCCASSSCSIREDSNPILGMNGTNASHLRCCFGHLKMTLTNTYTIQYIFNTEYLRSRLGEAVVSSISL